MLQTSSTLFRKAQQHPFNIGLYRGTLPRKAFNHFLVQDKLYLHEFSGVLKKIATRLPQEHHQQLFHKFSDYILKTEMSLHHKYLSPSFTSFFAHKEFKPMEQLPTVSEYIRYLHKTADNEPVAIAVASCLPCFSLYSDLGLHMKQQGVEKNNPYYLWIESYSSKNFLSSRDLLIDVTNNLASTQDEALQKKMIHAFIKSTHYELLFWDSVYGHVRVNAPETWHSKTQGPVKDLEELPQSFRYNLS